MHYNISLSDLISELKKICQEKLSGTVLIKTEDERLAQFNISNGNIIFLSIATKRGTDALPDIKRIKSCSFQFLHNVVSGLKINLPPTSEILNYLSTTAATDSVVPKSYPLSPEINSTLKATLAEFIGPVALMVSDEIIGKSSNLEAALNALANEIPNFKDRASFKEKAKKYLDAIFQKRVTR